jgi:hypothetical protein
VSTEASPEIIEIIDDDSNPFGDRAQSHPVHDSGGPRWVGPAAAAALVAIIGYGVATSTSSGVPQVAPVPTTAAAAPTTTIPAPTTTVTPRLVPYYSARPPRQYSVSYAATNEPDPNFYGDGTYELWATDQANASAGAWFSVETQGGGSSLFALDAYRVKADDRSIGITHVPSGHSVLHFTSSNGTADVTMTAFGITDERLVELARSVSVVNGEVHVDDESLFPSFRLVTGTHPWLALQGFPAEQIYYQSNSDLSNGITLNISPRTPPAQGGGTLDRQIAIRYFLDHPTPFSVDGHVAAAGAVVGQPTLAVATWIAGDHIVTVSGVTTVPQLITIARTVHPVPDNEWRGMQLQADRHLADGNIGNFDSSQPLPVAFGTDADAKNWLVNVVVVKFANEQQVEWQSEDAGYASRADGNAKINTAVTNDRTYVFADLPRAVAATASLQVTREGLDPVVVPFTDADPNFDRTFAAYAFSEATKYTAQILGADGTVLAQWPAA